MSSRLPLIAALVAGLTACSDLMEDGYTTWADAERAGAIDRGWVPAFVPKTARDIRDVHNIDTNAQILEFTALPSAIHTMVGDLQPASARDGAEVTRLAQQLGFRDVSSAAYIVCSRPLNGILFVDRESGRTVYKTPVDWADDDCSHTRRQSSSSS